MIVQRGTVVATFGDVERPWIVQSVRKSIVSSLVGMLVDEGAIALDATLADLDIDDVGGLSPTERRATLHDLLRARSGVYHEAAAESPFMRWSRPRRGSAAPGSRWYYNNWDFNVVGTIVARAAGTTVFDAFRRRIAEPIGMEDVTDEGGWDLAQPMSQHPAYHLFLSARDLARFGELILHRGRWGSEQVVPAAWVDLSTSPLTIRVKSGWDYGYMWWIGDGSRLDGHRHIAALGGAGHMLIVVPALELVIVHRNVGPSWRPTPWALGPIERPHPMPSGLVNDVVAAARPCPA